MKTILHEVRPRTDHRGVDLPSDVLPFGRLWYDTPDNAIGYAMHSSRSHDTVDSRLRCGWQSGRDARARGRFQRVVKQISVDVETAPCSCRFSGQSLAAAVRYKTLRLVALRRRS